MNKKKHESVKKAKGLADSIVGKSENVTTAAKKFAENGGSERTFFYVLEERNASVSRSTMRILEETDRKLSMEWK